MFGKQIVVETWECQREPGHHYPFKGSQEGGGIVKLTHLGFLILFLQVLHWFARPAMSTFTKGVSILGKRVMMPGPALAFHSLVVCVLITF